ncbi:ATP-binding protein [Lyngbya aestuarii]|uniref:ATP-binding protein n=1 Tax=Lyngbya aestuarii TaxID=118322 RepID=UPI00403DBFD0
MEEIIKILVVEDDEVDCMAVRRALKKAGLLAETVTAINCASAITTLNQQSFDCVILDYRLPDGDGLTLVKKIRSNGINIPLVVLTGQGDEQLAVELMKAGASDYLPKKKLSPQSLSRSLMNAVRIYRAEKEAAMATQGLLDSEERYRLVIEGSNDGFWDWDLITQEIYCNDRLYEIAGMRPVPASFTYKLFCQRLPRSDRVKIGRAVAAHLENNLELEVEFRLLHTSGEYRYCIARGKAQWDEQGQPLRISGVLSDISERKRSEESLRFQAQASNLLSASLDYRTTLENLAKLAVPRLADCCAIDVVESESFSRRLAVAHVHSGKEKLLWDWQRRYPTQQDDEYDFAKVLRSGQSDACFEISEELLTLMARDQSHLKLLQELNLKSYICVPLRVGEKTLGSILFIWSESGRRYSKRDLAFAEDLARRAALAMENARLYREAQEAEARLDLQNKILAQRNLQLLEASRLKSQFLATMSHELRTPMNSILGFSQMLLRQRQNSLTSQQADMIERILNNGKHLLALINDILDLSKIEAGRLELKPEPFNLEALVRTTIEQIRSLADEKHLALHVQTNLQDPNTINDSIRLRQILVNLVSNAIKFTEVGSVQVEVREISFDRLLLTVKDTGIGIASDDLENIFEEFRQLDQSITKKYPGTGLGLAITQSLVQLMQGSIKVESQLEQGSTFRVEFPREVKASSLYLTVNSKSQPGAKTAEKSPSSQNLRNPKRLLY